MKIFHCDHCPHLLFFENVQCVKCRRRLAYLPDLHDVGSLDPAGEGLWRSPVPAARGRVYRLCANYKDHDVCNWAVPAEDPNPMCLSCGLTRVIPNLEVPGHKAAWCRIEAAKRRLIYTLSHLRLPLANKVADPDHGLAFEFLSKVPARRC